MIIFVDARGGSAFSGYVAAVVFFISSMTVSVGIVSPRSCGALAIQPCKPNKRVPIAKSVESNLFLSMKFAGKFCFLKLLYLFSFFRVVVIIRVYFQGAGSVFSPDIVLITFAEVAVLAQRP